MRYVVDRGAQSHRRPSIVIRILYVVTALVVGLALGGACFLILAKALHHS